MTDIDWSKAPKLATHYNAAEGKNARIYPWMMLDDRGIWHFYNHRELAWLPMSDIFPGEHDVPVAVPNQAWTGQGLPPAGTVCEVKYFDDWNQTTIIGVDSRGLTVFESPWAGSQTPYAAIGYAEAFRPIRTPEQIAAEEREKAIDRMAEIAHTATGFCVNRADFAALYDAGYRSLAP